MNASGKVEEARFFLSKIAGIERSLDMHGRLPSRHEAEKDANRYYSALLTACQSVLDCLDREVKRSIRDKMLPDQVVLEEQLEKDKDQLTAQHSWLRQRNESVHERVIVLKGKRRGGTYGSSMFGEGMYGSGGRFMFVAPQTPSQELVRAVNVFLCAAKSLVVKWDSTLSQI